MAHYGAGSYGAGVYGAEAALVLTQTTDEWPTKVVATATGLASGQVVTISRTPPGETTRVTARGANALSMTTVSLVVTDGEQPFGVLLTYYLTIDGIDNDTATTTVTLDGGKVALTDAITGDAAEVVVLSWPSKKRERKSTVFQVGGRNIVVSGFRSGFAGTIELFAETTETVNNILDLVENATGGIMQIRQPGGYDGVDSYVAVLSDDEVRYSQDGSDERRLIALEVVEVERWAEVLGSTSEFDLADIYAAFPPPDDLADLAAAYATLLDLSLGDFS